MDTDILTLTYSDLKSATLAKLKQIQQELGQFFETERHPDARRMNHMIMDEMDRRAGNGIYASWVR